MTLHLKDLPAHMRAKIRKSGRTSGYEVAKLTKTQQLVKELEASHKPPRCSNKYNARRTEIDGITYHSAREAQICHALRLLERAGEILDLELQPKYKFVIDGVKIGTYTADARYFDLRSRELYGWHVIDVKSEATAAREDFKLKMKLMQALYGVTVELVF